MVFGHEEEITILRKEVEEKNTQLQNLVNGLTSENMTLKEDMKDLQKRVGKWERFSERFFGLSLEVLTELEEVKTPKKMIKIAQEQKESIPIIKTEETVVESYIDTIQEKTVEKPNIIKIEHEKYCPECGGVLIGGDCGECGYR